MPPQIDTTTTLPGFIPPHNLDQSLLHGHDSDNHLHRNLPCNWEDYYEKTQPLNTNTNARFPIAPNDTKAYQIQNALILAADPSTASAKLTALKKLSIPSNDSILKIQIETVGRHDNQHTLDKTVEEQPTIAQAKAESAMDGLRALKRCWQNNLARKREGYVWSQANKILFATTIVAGFISVSMAIASSVIAGPIGWVTLSLAAITAISKGINNARQNYLKDKTNTADSHYLVELQGLVRGECEDHGTVGHKITTLTFKDVKTTKSISHLVSEILNAGTDLNTIGWFDNARAFSEFGAERFFKG